MKNQEITCMICGHRFDPDAHASCQACPLVKGCSMVCCPQCGFQTVNPSESKLARFASYLFSNAKRAKASSIEER